ncbi:MAG: hypothetical protein HY812_17705 [Planctomycetes bacterium]|nr:hypothetical protein [Planctomycetota bacterium]
MLPRTLSGLFALLLVPQLCWSQDVLSTSQGQVAGDLFGTAIERFHDLNGDLLDDLAVGAASASPGGLTSAGEVAIVDSASGGRLLTIPGAVAYGRFGASVLRLPDLGGDGVPELAIGQPGKSGINPAGEVVILDGATLAPLGAVPGPGAGARLGEGLVLLDDVSGDLVPDFAASAPGHGFSTGSEIGAVLIIDPVTRSVLRTFAGAADFDSFGRGLGTIPDRSGDGRRDLVIGSPGFDPPGLIGAGRVQVFDAANGLQLLALPGLEQGDALGSACDGVLDLDADAVPDLVAGAPSARPGGVPLAGMGYVFSGATGQVLFTHPGAASGDALGRTVAGLGDLDGDGRGDYGCGSPLVNTAAGSGAGMLAVFSGTSHALLYRFEGKAANAGLGGALRFLGDLDADSRQDFAIGSPLFDALSGADAGKADIHLGQVGGLSIESTGKYGSPFTLALQATPGSLAFLFVDLAPGSFSSPFGQFYLGFTPVITVAFFGTLDPGGWLTFSGALPASGPPNLTFYTQCLVENPFPPPAYWTSGCAELTLVP